MYVGPDIVRPAAGSVPAKKSAITAFSAFICLGVILFLIAATIVLALIPIYTSTKSATLNRNTFTSKVARLVAVVGGTSTAGRKRASGDLSSVVGYSLNAAGLQQIHDQLLPTVQAKNGKDLIVNSAIFGYQNTGRKKRFALSRQRRDTTYVLSISFNIIYGSNCISGCQDTVGSAIQTGFLGLNGTTIITLVNVGVNGGPMIVNCASQYFQYVSTIAGSQSSASVGAGPTVYNTTTTTITTASTTATTASTTATTAAASVTAGVAG